MKSIKKDQPSVAKEMKPILREDDGKRTPPGPTGYASGVTPHSQKPDQKLPGHSKP